MQIALGLILMGSIRRCRWLLWRIDPAIYAGGLLCFISKLPSEKACLLMKLVGSQYQYNMFGQHLKE